MKITKFLPLLVGVFALAASLNTAEAKKEPVGFEAFKGSYSGQPVTIVYANTPYTAVANIVVSVPKSGKTAVITVAGYLLAEGGQFPLTNTFTLTKNSLGVEDVLFNLQSDAPGATGSGKLNSRGTSFAYTVFVTGAPNLPATGVVSVKPNGKKKKTLSLTLQVSDGNSLYSFPFTAVGKASKK